jgi:hypothetical protein
MGQFWHDKGQEMRGAIFNWGYVDDVKLVTVMLCSVLLVLGQAWSTPVASATTCARVCNMPCCHGGMMMSCCAAKTAGTAKPVAPVPLRGSVALPLLLLLALATAWQLPKLAAQQVAAVQLVPVYARKSRLYARDCSRLI